MDYRATLNLPQTDFPMKANLAQREPEQLALWEKEDLYGQVQEATADRPLYILHDGPPYANGHIHLGTAFNKVIKDIILRSKRMAGFYCPYVPGWDCHGLPIEHNVDKELGAKKKEIPLISFRASCRRYATKWIEIQRDEFKRLGVLGDWGNPYLTINYEYEACIAREFNRFLASGAVTRSKKPVYWCPSCRTALAEAEVEYHDHTSPSIYVKFPIIGELANLSPQLAGRSVFAVIWTTTPWTLPANLAVAVHPDFTYAAVEVDTEVWIIAEDLIETALASMGRTGKTLATFPGLRLEGRRARHPFMERESLLITAPYVTLDAGTGCVHTAPGHGREDYLSGIRYELPILSPVDDGGRFTNEAGPYAGQFILDANKQIIADMRATGALVQDAQLSHSYPHCWRCKKPVIFRATEQWFISMEANGIRAKALDAIREVNWTPRWGMERIHGMVEVRPDWCLSRQRAWGVPLTVISCRECGEVANNDEIDGRIYALFRKEGADAWFQHEVSDFVGENAKCNKCGSSSFVQERDILDVWFDSGVSYAAVLEERPELDAPADLYLEGSDQHRGWFQSSLLASVGTRGIPPYKGVLTHGFVVDGQGKKMSKSVGNVIAPAEIIKKYGAEILRLWVASEDYRDDIKISDEILKQLADAYRKLRNTIRFMLSNLYDFHPDTDTVSHAELEEIDKWVLHRFEVLKRRVVKAYAGFDFHLVFHGLYNFCTVTMSSLYLDILKDRLYTSSPASRQRRSAQTALHAITDGLLRLMAPVLAFTASEAWAFLPADPEREADAALARFPEDRDEYLNEALDARWERLIAVRGELTKVLELARQDKVIGHSLEAEVFVRVDGELAGFLRENWNTLRSIAIVSALTEVEELENGVVSEVFPELTVLVQAASGEKCERCWTRSETVGQEAAHATICGRCASVVRDLS